MFQKRDAPAGAEERARPRFMRTGTDAAVPDEAPIAIAIDLAQRAAEPPLIVRQTVAGGVHTLALRGSLDLVSVEALEAATEHVWSQNTRGLTLDLRELLFIDSSGLWAITRLHRRCAKELVRFSLIAGPDSVQRTFEETGLSDVLPFADQDGGFTGPRLVEGGSG